MLGTALALGVGAGLALSNQHAEDVAADTTASVTIADLNWTSSVQNGLGAQNAVAIDSNTSFYFTASDGNSGKYYDSASPKGARLYQTGNPSITVQAKAGYVLTQVTFTYATKNSGVLHTANGTSVTAAYSSGTAITVNNQQSFTAYVANSTSATNGQVAIQVVACKYTVSSNPVVTIDNAPDSLEKGATGTFTATPTNATNPSYAWSSSDANVLTVVEATGAYEAKATGSVTLTVNMTCDEGNASATADIVVNAGLISIEDAIAIADAFDDSQSTTTEYTVTLQGYITDLNADNRSAGSERALYLSSAKVSGATADNRIMVFGIYSSDALRKYAVLNGTLKVEGKVQNFKGTFELTAVTVISYTDEAETFAKAAYAALQEACNTGVQAVTEEAWNALATQYAAVDEYSQAKLKAADVSDYREDITKWVARYELIVNNSNLADFMERGLVNAAISTNTNNNTNGGIIALIVIAVVASVSLASVVTIVVIKRRFTR